MNNQVLDNLLQPITGDWAELINNHYLESVVVREVDGEWLEESGNLPQHYQDIPMDKFT